MAQNTHYHVIQDGPTLLNSFSEKSFSRPWNPSNDIVLNVARLSPILSFRADPSNDAENLKFKVSMRNQNALTKEVASFTWSGTVSRTIFEVMDRSAITKDGMNFIFEVTDGKGSLNVSDIVVWFHRET
jgi:hypothetical protein